MFRKVGFLSCALLLAAQIVKADICDDLKSIGDGKGDIRVKNCKQAMKAIPNKEGFTYTVQYLKDNYHHLADPSCAMHSSSVARGVLSRAKVEEGVQNGCQFIFNDLKRPFKGMSNRSTAYYVDLCSSDPGKVVSTIYMNRGTGSSRRGYVDQTGKKTTLAGAFLTDDQTFAFNPFKMNGRYLKIKKQLGGKIPALRLVGLNSSNNSSEYGKPIHASPYNSSWGCPSVAPENAWVMKKLASGGPSLLMNYGPATMHRSTTTCGNLGASSKPAGRAGKHGNSGERKGSQ